MNQSGVHVAIRYPLRTFDQLDRRLLEIGERQPLLLKGHRWERLDVASLQIISEHGRHLKRLQLTVICCYVSHMHILKGCSNLELFYVKVVMPIEVTHEKDAGRYAHMFDWLERCEGLKYLRFGRFHAAPLIVGRLLSRSNIQLRELAVAITRDTSLNDFLPALQNSHLLESLIIERSFRAYFEDSQLDTVFKALPISGSIRKLRICNKTFHGFDELFLASGKLKDLEYLEIRNADLSHEMLEMMHWFQNLKFLDIEGCVIYRWDLKSILGYISKLGPGNEGLFFALSNDGELRDEEGRLDEALRKKVNGHFLVKKFSDS